MGERNGESSETPKTSDCTIRGEGIQEKSIEKRIRADSSYLTLSPTP
ncbi:hypothetical protein CCACVL1_27333 [Corchorus capsularis]|uniref:Uncharacterized protein n=1 Tax=Corchorus capsularis TaxID=210143 RepID=A0A1R3GB76_COCAP|nr:hypothetical protein CCACVL1_27333 [Corchorus capsularis]